MVREVHGRPAAAGTPTFDLRYGWRSTSGFFASTCGLIEAAIAAALAFWLHRSLIEVVAVMAALGIVMRLILGA